MKVLILSLGVLLPTIYSATLEYPTDITSFSFTWGNPEWTSSTQSGPSQPALITDGDLYTGEQLLNPSTETGSWGKQTANTQGMTGTFYADTLEPGTGYSHWSITTAKITLGGDGCFGSKAVADFYYEDTNGNAVVNTITVSMSASPAGDASQNYIVPTTFTAELPAVGIATNGAIGFSIASNSYCEGILRVLEFELEGTAIMTDEPTKSPSPEPTTSPTTAEPTMAPTKDCSGEVTWGDPHFRLVSINNDKVDQYNYQGLGWYYYIFPCDMDDYEGWPFYLQSYHTRCYWRNNPKGCINNNRLILNTKPDPWIIEFTGQGFSITVGTDAAGQTASDFNTNQVYTESNPLVIEYNDGQTNAQYGEMKIFYDNNRKGTLVIQLYNVGFNAYPRSCNKGMAVGLECGDYVCSEQVIDIRNSGSYTWYSCPTCLRNIACGIMGRYIRGDCRTSDLKDPQSECYDILQGSDGTLYQPPVGDSIFEPFADSWHEDVVNALIEGAGYSVLYQKNKKMHSSSPHISLQTAQTARHSVLDGRDLNIDNSRLEGDCANNPARVAVVNETCRLNTVVKYDKCCKEIGFCDIFWNACIEDLCACYDTTDPNMPANITEEWCLDTIVHQSMNTTCSIEALYPTATPTAAPTPAPVGIVNGLPKGQKAEDLIWLYLIFVAIFIIIAAGAYWYYRKKNVGVGNGRATFDDNIEAPQIS